MERRPLLTSIGSFPAMSNDPMDAMHKIVAFQRAYGLDVLSDGEGRADILHIYAGFPGVRVGGGVPRIVGRIEPLADPAAFFKIRDLDHLRSAYPDALFKITLTGPSTFALACGSSGAGPAYKSALDPVLHDDLVEAIRPLAHEAARRGALVQIDDPILSQGMRDFGPTLRRLDAIASEVPRDRMNLHVCGGLARGKVLEALMGLEHISTLLVAFAGRMERANEGLLDPRAWEDRDLFLGAGSIPVQVSRKEEVASPEEVASLLRRISERMGPSRFRYVLPDCGFRGTANEFVPDILGNLRKGFEAAFPSPS